MPIGERVIPRQGIRQNGPVTSGEGAPLWEVTRRRGQAGFSNLTRRRGEGQHTAAAGNWPGRLFNKNTGLCKAERQRIGADACPAPGPKGRATARSYVYRPGPKPKPRLAAAVTLTAKM